MLKLMRVHERAELVYDELDNSEGYEYVEKLKWEIGAFRSFDDILDYLYKYHEYKKFKKFDKDEMLKCLFKNGYVWILHNDEYDKYGLITDECRISFVVKWIPE